MHVTVEPAAGGKLVLDQPVRRRGIRHAQQRLGQHHERQPFAGGERVGVEKILDAAEPGRFGADRFDQFFRACVDPVFGGAVAAGIGKKDRCQFLVRLSERRVKIRKPGLGRGHCANLSLPNKAGKDKDVN